MGENAPKPEKQPRPIVLTCDGCFENFRAPVNNTINYVFTEESQYSVICIQHLNGECTWWNSVFHDQHLPLLADIAREYPTSIYQKLEDLEKDDPDSAKWVKDQRVELEQSADYEAPEQPKPIEQPELPKLIEPQPLTPRQESYIQHWGEFLQKVVIDLSDFGEGDEPRS